MICLDIPMPDNCGQCRLMADGWCRALQGDSHLNRYAADMDKRPDWCPLKEQSLVDTVPVASIEDEIRSLMTLGNPFATNMSMQLSGMLNRWKERDGNG